MTPKVSELLKAALALPAAEREELADCLWSSLDPVDECAGMTKKNGSRNSIVERPNSRRTSAWACHGTKSGICGDRLMAVLFHRLAARNL